MVFVNRRDLRRLYPKIGNFGAGIGSVKKVRGRLMKKKNKFFESFGQKLLDTAFDMGKNLYDQNKDKINQVIRDKAGDIVNKVIDKTKESVGDSKYIPDFAKKKLIDNSDLISNVSKKYIDQMVNKGLNMADSGVNHAYNMGKSQISTPLKREPPTFVAPTSSNMISGTTSTDMPSSNRNYGNVPNTQNSMIGFGYNRHKNYPRYRQQGKGLSIL